MNPDWKWDDLFRVKSTTNFLQYVYTPVLQYSESKVEGTITTFMKQMTEDTDLCTPPIQSCLQIYAVK